MGRRASSTSNRLDGISRARARVLTVRSFPNHDERTPPGWVDYRSQTISPQLPLDRWTLSLFWGMRDSRIRDAKSHCSRRKIRSRPVLGSHLQSPTDPSGYAWPPDLDVPSGEGCHWVGTIPAADHGQSCILLGAQSCDAELQCEKQECACYIPRQLPVV
jgi:hypothetical protein